MDEVELDLKSLRQVVDSFRSEEDGSRGKNQCAPSPFCHSSIKGSCSLGMLKYGTYSQDSKIHAFFLYPHSFSESWLQAIAHHGFGKFVQEPSGSLEDVDLSAQRFSKR